MPNIKIKSNAEREMYSPMVSYQQVFCPHCGKRHDIMGMGLWKCDQRNRVYRYDGPFHGICHKCEREIKITPPERNTKASCPHCGQNYDFKVSSERSSCINALETCTDCCGGHI